MERLTTDEGRARLTRTADLLHITLQAMEPDGRDLGSTGPSRDRPAGRQGRGGDRPRGIRRGTQALPRRPRRRDRPRRPRCGRPGVGPRGRSACRLFPLGGADRTGDRRARRARTPRPARRRDPGCHRRPTPADRGGAPDARSPSRRLLDARSAEDRHRRCDRQAVARAGRPARGRDVRRRGAARQPPRDVRHPHGSGVPARQRRDADADPAVGRPAARGRPGRDHGHELQARVLRRALELPAGGRWHGGRSPWRSSASPAGATGSRRQSSGITRSAKANSAPPAGSGLAQTRPPMARTSRAQTNSPIPAPVVAVAVFGER